MRTHFNCIQQLAEIGFCKTAKIFKVAFCFTFSSGNKKKSILDNCYKIDLGQVIWGDTYFSTLLHCKLKRANSKLPPVLQLAVTCRTKINFRLLRPTCYLNLHRAMQ